MNQIAKTTPSTVTQLKAHLAERPAKGEIGKMLAPIFTAFPTSADGENAAGKVGVYALAISDLPPWATTLAVIDFIKGNVPEHDGRFLPTPAQLAKRARCIRNLKSIAEYKRIANSKPVEPNPKPMTEDEMQRRREQVAKLLGPDGLTA